VVAAFTGATATAALVPPARVSVAMLARILLLIDMRVLLAV
jgi:hypothetical protein